MDVCLIQVCKPYENNVQIGASRAIAENVFTSFCIKIVILELVSISLIDRSQFCNVFPFIYRTLFLVQSIWYFSLCNYQIIVHIAIQLYYIVCECIF